MADERRLNREAWLHRMAEMLRPWFREHGYPIHGRITLTMATTGGKAILKGFCTTPVAKDGTNHVIISAYENYFENTVEVCATLVHELTHAVLPPKAGHGKLFKAAAEKLKFVRKPDQAGAYSGTVALPELKTHLEQLIAAMPHDLPRHGLMAHRPIKAGGRSSNKMFKFQCDDCKTTVYLKYTSLDRAGDPVCWNADCDACGMPMGEQASPHK